MAGVHWLALILLYVGLALALVSTALYIRSGLRQARKLARGSPERPVPPRPF
jgi:hypothetical protein